jgi:hypothetical protein
VAAKEKGEKPKQCGVGESIELTGWLYQGRLINHLAAARGFGEGQDPVPSWYASRAKASSPVSLLEAVILKSYRHRVQIAARHENGEIDWLVAGREIDSTD